MTHGNWVKLAAIAAGISVTAGSARAEEPAAQTDVARAESYAAEAFEAYSTEDYEQAIALYEKALEAAPSPDIVYNIARIYDTKLQDRGRAIEYYARYARDTGADPDRLRSVHERLARLRELEAIAAAAPKPNPPSVERHARVADTPREVVGPTEADAPARAGLSAAQIVGIAVGGAGVAALGVGVGFGVAARSDARVAHDHCDGDLCFTQRGVEAAREASRTAMISTVACIAGGALLASGTGLLLFGSEVGSERAAAGLELAPYAAYGELGARLDGRF